MQVILFLIGIVSMLLGISLAVLGVAAIPGNPIGAAVCVLMGCVFVALSVVLLCDD